MSLYVCLASMALLGAACFLMGWFVGLRHGMEHALCTKNEKLKGS